MDILMTKHYGVKRNNIAWMKPFLSQYRSKLFVCCRTSDSRPTAPRTHVYTTLPPLGAGLWRELHRSHDTRRSHNWFLQPLSRARSQARLQRLPPGPPRGFPFTGTVQSKVTILLLPYKQKLHKSSKLLYGVKCITKKQILEHLT